ncbi:MAG TPA: carbonic anhydrase family protein [Rhizomicrobium sp.]|nr:carbonic anhydrase family protein [Rhizomicrobium sp.]
MRKINPVTLMAGALLLLALPSHAQWRTPWSYDGDRGPAHWAALDPDYALCGSGQAQSPIDIEATRKAGLPALRFAYRPGSLTIINNGYTALRVDYPSGSGDFLIVGGKSYELTQFHFHRPSEERIRGRAYDMVLHLMHRGIDGKVVGVAVMLEQGRANPAVGQLWKYMPESAGKDHLIPGVIFDPKRLIPPGTGYYSYEGSQTAPPCTEGVTWYVMKTPIEVSADQIAAFAKLYPHDVRPVQPPNGRIVEEGR